MNYIKIPIKIFFSILGFCVFKMIPSFLIKKEERDEKFHKSKWVWINYSYCQIDVSLIKYIKKLNELGYITRFCCQGFISYENGKKNVHSPYICADTLPENLIDMAKRKNFHVKRSHLGLSIYFDDRNTKFEDYTDQLLLNNIIEVLEEWYQLEESNN